MQLQVLTHTRLATLRQCQKLHYLRFELGWTPTRDAKARRFGRNFHVGQEVHNKTRDQSAAVGAAIENYAADDYEGETVRALLSGHFWRYEPLDIVASEKTFEFPLVNPETGAASRTFVVQGKIDAIVKLADGRVAVLEYKTAGEDIGPESAYWLRLRADAQVSMYVLGARSLGYETNTVIYDASRKPTIAPLNVPILDENKDKIVLDATGQRVLTKQGKPRQTADKELGYVLQTRPETPAEWGARLLADIGDRPDYYYARREVPRLEDELEEFRLELWQQGKQLMDAQRHGRWFRNVSRWNCNNCDFSGPCLQNLTIVPGNPPVGFEVLDNVNPELEEV